MTESILYLDPSNATHDRVLDLMQRMTLEEKVAQLVLADGRYDAEELVSQDRVGAFLHILGDKTFALQKLAQQSRLQIPLLFGIDAIHGHGFWPGATVFPTQLALSCSWQPGHAKTMARVTAREMIATGLHWTFSPVLCLTRDLRWGRVGETFGEDQLLIADFARAAVEGYQGDSLDSPYSVAACAKHYAGYSQTVGGRDATEAELSRRKLLSDFLPPFQKAVEAGCRTFMTAYQAIDGVPACINQWLMVEVLREQWGYEGMVVTDWDNVGRLQTFQKVVATKKEGVPPSVRAQNDMIMCTPEFFQDALASVHEGKISVAEIDRGCRRVLALKFDLGLFDDKRHCAPLSLSSVGCDEHRAHLLPAALDGLVLLKNDGVLPLGPKQRRIAVLGPNADDILAQLGDWSFGSGQASFLTEGHPRHLVTTVLDAFRSRSQLEVVHARGCDVVSDDASGIAEAAELARTADVAVVVVGDTLELIGERCDRSDLALSGGQLPLLAAVQATGTPMVVVLINSKPLTIPWVVEHAGAVLEAFNPGMAGGEAIVRTLLGEHNPCGKLTVSFPSFVGAQPVHYQQIPGWHDGPQPHYDPTPLYAFGFGLSYTTFALSDLALPSCTLTRGASSELRVKVKNTGRRRGVEVVQVYINDLVTSATTVEKTLIGYERVTLEPGEATTVTFPITPAHLTFVDQHGNRIMEPGEFEVMVGNSSRDEDLLRARFTLE